ncbi:endonuclease/exonuclease/phosphatase family protein [Sphingobacterium chuzhouense]|uniref:Endonuclease/exonuclease/phosphatase family protein n=1 Tax=Sphingobacterium chuzhouense TaxID=1742264 RepID=A0ABR7XRU0_9SPHI|nr:endonuclease/exonuclease/phosphatase family protein [Sphingobacterium chuzhouense]MBD1421885.1 endonuclease/exonuclease/phosphatase family protein [Sphingobacterium chuzhouense]
MKLFHLILAATLLYSCGKNNADKPDDPPPSENETTVTVMTYNIWGARSGGIPDLQVIADVIKRANPDLVALQEVDKNTTRNAIHGDVAKKLGELTGMEHYFVNAINTWGGEYGDAVLSKLPIKEKKGYNLDVTPELGGERRSVARILVEKDEKEFYFISTHFDHLSNEANRIKQATDFVALTQTFDKPVIVGADFNATPNSNPMNILRQHFSYGCMDVNCNQPTFSTDNPRTTIDYLIYTPQTAFTSQMYSVYTWAKSESDHFPVLATFKINF